MSLFRRFLMSTKAKVREKPITLRVKPLQGYSDQTYDILLTNASGVAYHDALYRINSGEWVSESELDLAIQEEFILEIEGDFAKVTNDYMDKSGAYLRAKVKVVNYGSKPIILGKGMYNWTLDENVVLGANITRIEDLLFSSYSTPSYTFSWLNNEMEFDAQTDSEIIFANSQLNGGTVYTINGVAYSRIENIISPVVLENGITYISNYLFQGITNAGFTSITIPATVSKIGRGVFKNGSGSMPIVEARFNQPYGMAVELPTAGNPDGMFYVKTARAMTIYTDNETVKNYNYSADNITATIKHLDGSDW